MGFNRLKDVIFKLIHFQRCGAILAVNGKLCRFYIIWKLHKATSSSGLRSRPIASATDFVTVPASHFLDRQLKKAVWSHPYVLRDSRELVWILQGLEFAPGDRVMLTA